MKSFFSSLVACILLVGLSGCAGYQRGSAVPTEFRTIHVPAFENQTRYPMVGAVATQQFIDALIEDGTFAPEELDTARLRLQVVITGCQSDSVRYDRNNVIVPTEYYLTLRAKIYLSDAQTGETYIDGKAIHATDVMLTRNQFQTAVTDVMPRLSRKLAKNLLDELQSFR